MIRLVVAVVAVLFAAAAVAALDPPELVIVRGRAIPKGGTVIVTPAGKPGPGQKDHKPVATATDVTGNTPLPAAGTYDLYFTPKGGLPVKLLEKWEAKVGKQTVTLSDHLGTVFVRSDDLPRADAVVVTATDDPGPGEKGHIAIQKAGDYKEDMVVPAGTYAVWVMPFNGAKAQKVADNVRVLAGREAKVPE